MSNVHIFSVGTDVRKMFELKQSADEANLKIDFIIPPKWNGFIDKITYMNDAIHNLPDRDIVCFIDAYDVLAFGSKDELKEKFIEMDTDFLISAEVNLYPGSVKNFPDLPSKTIFRYVNSGTYMGYKFAVKEFLTWKSVNEAMKYIEDGGDQHYLIAYFIEYYKTKRILLDHDQKIFQLMFGVSWHDLKIRDGRLWNSVLDTTPNFVHFNGDSHLTDAGQDVREHFNRLILQGENDTTVENVRPKYNYWGRWRSQRPS